jgi:hypothetical protein
MKLHWTSVNDAHTYAISYGIRPGTYLYGILDVGNVTEYTINDLDPNQTYYAVVRATNGCSQGNQSNELPNANGAVSGGQVLGASTLAATGVQDVKFAWYSIISGLIGVFISIYGTYAIPAKKNRIAL